MVFQAVESDQKLLLAIAEHRVMTVHQIATLLSRNQSRLRSRLRKLAASGFIEVTSRPFGASRGRPAGVVSVGSRGVDFLKSSGGLDASVAYDRVTARGIRCVEHELLVNDIRVQMAELPRVLPAITVRQLAPLSPQLPIDDAGHPLVRESFELTDSFGDSVEFIPDAVIGVHHGGLSRTLMFFVEADRATEPLVSRKHSGRGIRQKISNYKAYFCSRRFTRYEELLQCKLQGFRVLVVSDSVKRFDALSKLVREMAPADFVWLTARVYPHGINLHDLWKRSCDEHARLKEWSEGKPETHKFGVMVLRTLALLRGLDPKPRILIDLVPDGFEDDWRRAALAIERALELVTHVGPDGFGVFEKKWLPGFGLIPVLAAMRAEIEDRGLDDAPRADLRRWYWCNVFLERFSSGVESKSRKDYSEMLSHWVDGAAEPAVFAEAEARIGAAGYTVADSASYASAVYSGIFCLLALRGARDWRRGESIQLQELNDHHIFPRAYLREKGIAKRAVVNSVVNRTLISGETNKKIKKKAPAEYVACEEICPSGATEALLAPHFFDGSSIDSMRSANDATTDGTVAEAYSSFCKARERIIVDEIRRVCGVRGADAEG